MTTRTKILGLLALPSFLLSQGCIIVGVHGWSDHPKVWSESVSEEFSIDSAGVSALEIRTHNGPIGFSGSDDASGAIHVIATKKAGGRSADDARAALDALEVYSEPSGNGTQKIGWRWHGVHYSRWQAKVSFDITGPSELNIDAETRNGRLHIADVDGDVRIATRNGGIRVEAARGKLSATTRNGPISASYSGGDLILTTRNGSIAADLGECVAPNAILTTRNGRIELVVGEAISGQLTASTRNGSIRCDVPMTQSTITRRQLTGRLGDGRGTLDIATRNGGIRIKKTSG